MSKAGRKKLNQEAKKHFKRITVCYSKSEYDLLQKKLEMFSGPNSVFVREMSLRDGKLPKSAKPRVEEDLVKELNRVGVNLNQITRKVNELRGVHSIENDIVSKLDEAISILIKIQMKL